MKRASFAWMAVLAMTGSAAMAQYPGGGGYRPLGGGLMVFPSGSVYSQSSGFSGGVRQFFGPYNGVYDNPEFQSSQRQFTQRPSESIDATSAKGTLRVKWVGEPLIVQRIRFQILDKDRRLIKETLITRQPTEAKFTITSKTAFYRAIVEYVDGATNTVTSPI